METTVADVRQALLTVRNFVRGVEVGAYSGGDAAQLVAIFADGRQACSTAEMLFARRADECSEYKRTGHRSTADWLSSVTRTPYLDAQKLVQTGRSIELSPALE